jgi:hypothetical protein
MPIREQASPSEGDRASPDHGTPEAWDPRAAIYAALRAAGPPRHPARLALVAQLAFRLARQGHVIEVTFRVADGTPHEAIRSALADLAPDTTPEAEAAPGDAISPADGSQAVPGPPHALVSVQEACVKRARTCLVCGKVFEVNFRHTGTHRFCSAGCRSKHRHRLKARVTPRLAPTNF